MRTSSRLEPRRYQEVPRPLGRRAREGRRLDLDELPIASTARATRLTSLRNRIAAAGPGRGGPGSDTSAGFLAHAHPVVDLERQRVGGAQHVEPGRDHLDLTRRQVKVGVSSGRRATSPTIRRQYSFRSS